MLMLGAWHVTLFAILFITVCLFMLLVILIQKPRGGGLSGAFGGAGGSAQAAFGAKTGDVLTWFTVVCFGAFLLLAIGLTWSIRPSNLDLAPVIQAPDTSQTDAGRSELPVDVGVLPNPNDTAQPPVLAAPQPPEASP